MKDLDKTTAEIIMGMKEMSDDMLLVMIYGFSQELLKRNKARKLKKA